MLRHQHKEQMQTFCWLPSPGFALPNDTIFTKVSGLTIPQGLYIKLIGFYTLLIENTYIQSMQVVYIRSYGWLHHLKHNYLTNYNSSVVKR